MFSRPTPTRLALSIAAISLVFASRAHAQSAPAEAMFNEGDKLMSAGKLAEACAAFDASNNLDPRAGTLIRLGECRELSNQLASAWAAYKAAFARAKDPYKRDVAAAKVTGLEPRLSHLTIVVGAHNVVGLTVTRDGKPIDATTWDRSLPIDGGSYVIAATAPGHQDWHMTVVVPVENGDVKATLPELRPRPAVSQEVAHESPAAAPSRLAPRRKVAVAVAGSSVVALLGGVVLGIVAKGKRDDAFDMCPDPGVPCPMAARADSLTSSAHRLAISANIGFGIAAVAAISGGILWFTGEPQSPPRTAILPTANGLAVTGRF
jgi:hypothetical protein